VAITEQYLRAVAFLCIEFRGQRIPSGTAFFVSVGDGTYDQENETWTSGEIFTYAVTARHCIEDNIGDPPIYLRINDDNGTFKDKETHKGDWLIHPSADVAALLMSDFPPSGMVESLALPLFVSGDYKCRRDFQEFFTRLNVKDAALKTQAFEQSDGIEIELGDDLFFPGLFYQSAGKQQNLPIVRFGHIARMPREEITLSSKARGDFPARAYLAEIHSWRGHSGSPAFWHKELNVPERFWLRGLLGLVSAHFDLARASRKSAKGRARVVTNEAEIKLNSGIAVVTPAENIKELLMSPKAVRDREQGKSNREKRGHVAVVDFASPESDSQVTHAPKRKDRIAIPIPTRSQFESDLAKAMRRKKG